MHPAGHQVVPGALGGWTCASMGASTWQEAVGVQDSAPRRPARRWRKRSGARCRAGAGGGPGSWYFKPQGLLPHMVPSSIQGSRAGAGPRRARCRLLRPELHLARWPGVGLQRLRVPLPHIAVYGNDRFVFQLVRRRKLLRRKLSGIKHHLKDPFPVLRSIKHDTAHVPLWSAPSRRRSLPGQWPPLSWLRSKSCA